MESAYGRFNVKKAAALLLAAVSASAALSGCGAPGRAKTVRLDPRNPVTVTVWHYYNGPILNAFEEMVKTFNETVGAREGIIVEGHGMGSVADLERSVIASANKEIGSLKMPNIFTAYADTAYQAEKMGLLARLDEYFPEGDQEAYLDAYIDEGKIGPQGALRIFPIAKATEVMMINETDWLPFAAACGLTYDDLNTMEGVALAAEKYYQWTDARTPDAPDDGKSFFGRDSMANFFLIASKEFGIELFGVEDGRVGIHVDRDVMRRIWDCYYIPYISGYYSAYGRFRSDDARVGDILCYVGSTASASYFPDKVTVDGATYPVKVRVRPAPHFRGADRVMVQQGAGMAVTKATPQEEYAGVVFLKWFTGARENIEFAALSGYMPVKKEAADYEVFIGMLEQSGQALDEITRETLRIAFAETETSELYTNRAFDGGVAARAVIETHLQSKADADREAVLRMMEGGSAHGEAVAAFKTEENFNGWLADMTSRLYEAIE